MSPHDLLEMEEARIELKMTPKDFQSLVAEGQLPAFRAGGKICFRREDLDRVAKKGGTASSSPKTSDKKPDTKKSNTKPFVGKSMTKVLRKTDTQTIKPSKTITLDKETTKESSVSTRKKAASKTTTSPKPASASSAKSASVPKTPLYSKKKPAIPKWAIAAGVVAVLLALYTFNKGKKSNSTAKNGTGNPYKVLPQPFEKRFAAPGLVEAASGSRSLSFQIAGTIKKFHIQEGDAIKKGDMIAELENSPQKAQLQSAEADMDMAKANLSELQASIDADILKAERDQDRLSASHDLLLAGSRKEKIEQAKGNLEVATAMAEKARLTYEKYSKDEDIRSGVFTPQQRDDARYNWNATVGTQKVAEQQLQELKEGARKEEIATSKAILEISKVELNRLLKTKSARLERANAQIKQTQAQLDFANAEYEKTYLKSPINGKVIYKYRKVGESVTILQNDFVVTVADLGDLLVRADVDEADYDRVFPGQRVKLQADAFGDRFFEGEVVRRSDQAGQKRFSTGEAKEKMDVKVVETLIRFKEHCPFLLNLRVTAYFEDNKKKGPKSADNNASPSQNLNKQ